MRARVVVENGNGGPAPTVNKKVAGDTLQSHAAKRRLSTATPTHVSVESRQVHEFPSGHSCGTIAGFVTSLPLKADGSVSWDPSPSDVTDQVSIGTVDNPNWSQARLQAPCAQASPWAPPQGG